MPGSPRVADDLDGHEGLHRVVEGPQIGVDLLREVAGQEAEALARLDDGPGEDELALGLGEQLAEGPGHREVGLARPGGADGEDEIVAGQALEVERLRPAPREDLGEAAGTLEAGVEEVAPGLLVAGRAVEGPLGREVGVYGDDEVGAWAKVPRPWTRGGARRGDGRARARLSSSVSRNSSLPRQKMRLPTRRSMMRRL